MNLIGAIALTNQPTRRRSASQRGAFVGPPTPRWGLFFLVPINSESQMEPLHTLKPDSPA
jgi:hypothetical protein